MRPWRSALVGGMASVALVLSVVSASGLAGAQGTHKRTAAAGGTLVYALPEQTQIPWYFPYANAANASLYSFELIDQLYLPLFYIGDNYKINYADSIADKVTYNKAGTIYHVFMNPKWKWSDGAPVTSADAQFGWNMLIATMNPKAPAPWPNDSYGSGDVPTNIQSFAVNGTYEFTVTLKKPVNQEWFIYNGLNLLYVMPAQAWNKYPTDTAKEVAYLGKNATNPTFDTPVDGPFELQSATQSQDWVLVPNPSFAGHRSTLSRLIFQYEGSDAAEFAGLKTGTIQVGYLPAADWAARSQLSLDTMSEEFGYIFNYTMINMTAQAPGGVGKIFSQLYVRQALSEATDQSAIVNVIYHGQAKAQYGPIPSDPRTDFFDPALAKPLYPYNLAAAKKLLTSHGWKEVGGVMTQGKEQLKFTMIYPSGDEAQTEAAELMQADWAKIGVQVTLKPTPLVTEFGLEDKPNAWQIAAGTGIIYGGTYPSGESLFYKNQGLDTMGWNNPEENALVEKTISPSPTPAANLRNFYAYEMYTARALPGLWFPETATDVEVEHNVLGFSVDTNNPVTGIPLMNFWSVK